MMYALDISVHIGYERDHYKEKVQTPEPKAERGHPWINYGLALPCYRTGAFDSADH
jgi:hypothetical protein